MISGAKGRVSRVLLAALVMLAARGAGAQTWPSASSPATLDHPQSHAWAVMPDHAGRPGSGPAVLVHVPPRSGALPAQSGSAHLVRTLNDVPLAVAAWGDQVFLAFHGVGPDRNALVRIRSLRAIRQGFGWVYDPIDRFSPNPAIEHRGSVRSMAAGDRLVVVVLTPPEGPDEVFALIGGSWREVDLAPVGGPSAVWAFAHPEGVRIGWAEGDALVTAELVVDGERVAPGPRCRTAGVAAPSQTLCIGRDFFAFDRDEDQVSARLLPNAAPLMTARVTERSVLVPVFADGARMIGLWWETLGRDGKPASLPALHTMEWSLATGAVLHEGPQPTSKFISMDEFRTLAVLLFVVVLGVLVIVLRGDLDLDAVPLPPGFALAEPSRRFIGTGLDFALAALVVAQIYGVEFRDLISLRLLFMSDSDWTAVPAVFVTGAVIGTLCEWAFGRTVGKLLTSTRVVRSVSEAPGATRIGPRRAFIRNAVKWLLPPVAVLAALDGNGRHRGDQIAGVAVVVELEAEGPQN